MTTSDGHINTQKGGNSDNTCRLVFRSVALAGSFKKRKSHGTASIGMCDGQRIACLEDETERTARPIVRGEGLLLKANIPHTSGRLPKRRRGSYEQYLSPVFEDLRV